MKNEIFETEMLFKALGREKRMRIINYLMTSGRVTVTIMSHDLHIPMPTLSRHLMMLTQVGLLERHPIRSEVYYEIDFGSSKKRRVYLFALIKNAYEIEDRKSKSGPAFDPVFLNPYSELLKYVRGR